MAEEEEYLHITGHISLKEAATMLGLSEDRVWQHIQSGRLPARKVSGRYMIPLQALENFQRKPRGRTRRKPVTWRAYQTGAEVHELHIEVQTDPGKQQTLQTRLQAVLREQKHLFPGTMQRYVLADRENPGTIVIQLVWKDTELTDEATLQHDLDTLKAEFADVLDWSTARYARLRAIIQT
jgi:excisionase family DNA binding protein